MDTATSNNNETINSNIISGISDEANDTGFEEEVNSYVGVVSVNLSAPKAVISVGETLKASYTISPNDATNQSVTFDSSDDSIAIVDKNGNIKGISKGTVDISIKTTDGNKTSFITINVVEPKVESTLTLNKQSIIIKKGQTESLKATVSPANTKLVWSSSNSKVVKVDSNGKITGVSQGSAVITVQSSDGKMKSTCNVSVTNATVEVTGITLNKSSATIYPGSTLQLSVTYKPSNATKKGVTYKSSNESVAVVDSNGKVTAKGLGKTVITATSTNGKTTSCTINVVEAKIEKITLNKSSVQITKGSKFNLKVSIKPSSAAKKISYTSSNKAIATVDNNGVITAVGIGTTTIKVKATDGSGKVASIKVTVQPKGNLINISKLKYTTYKKDIANYIGVTFSKHMQNFAIQNPGASNEIIYLSGVTTGCITATKINSSQKADLNRTFVIRIPSSQLNVNTNNRTIMWMKNSGHGQSFDIEKDGTMWTNAFGKEPTYSGGKWWGGHTGIMRIKFNQNKRDGAFSPLTTLKVKDSSGTLYTGVEAAIDEDNDMIAIRAQRNVFVYRLSSAKKGKLDLLYSFKISETTTYKQGIEIYGGYFYLITGAPGGAMAISAYNMLGERQYSKSFYIKNASQAKKLNEEPEGIKIYNGKIYIGHTHAYGKGYLFDIGVFK